MEGVGQGLESLSLKEKKTRDHLVTVMMSIPLVLDFPGLVLLRAGCT